MSKTYKLKSSRRKLIAKEKRIWIGFDVHKTSFTAVILDREELLHRATLPMDKAHVRGLLRRLKDCDIDAVYEAGPTGYQFLRWLREFGCDAMMCAPSMVPTKSGDRVKTDRRDALKLAECLRAQMLAPIYDLTDEGYERRELIRTRKQTVRRRVQVAQQIKSKLLFHGIDTPQEVGRSWSKSHLAWLENSPSGRPCIDSALASLVRTWRHLTEEIHEFDRQIRQLAKEEDLAPKVELLTSAPGIGLLTAMTFLLELENVDRFGSCEQLSGYLGLIPSEDSTGNRKNKGGLTRTGNEWVRSALVESSWVTIGSDEKLRSVYDRIKHKNGKDGAQIAIVAVARRLGLALRAMLRDQKDWRQKDAG